jgi:N-dimethylarginine dimethylaminohydrolase
MKQVAQSVPSVLPLGVESAGLPASLPPEDALALLDLIRELPAAKREEEIYLLPADQQAYVRTALAAESPTPPSLPSLDTEDIQYPIIDEAVRLLSEKNIVTREEFDRLSDASRQKAFTVAGVSSRETIDKIRDALTESVQEGADLKDFRDKILRETEDGTFLSEGHLENVFRTGVQAQYSDGQVEVLNHPFVRQGFPYTTYNAIHDDRVRPNHLALEKLGIGGSNVYRINDPVFQRFRPPWDYNDRCNWRPLSISQAADMGIDEAKRWLSTGEEPSPPAFVPMPPFEPPPSFERALLSIRLALSPLSDWEEEENTSRAVLDPPLVHAQGEGHHSAVGDYAKERHGNKHKGMKRRSLLRGKRRKLSRDHRLKKPGGAPSLSLQIPDPPAISTGNVVPEPPTSGDPKNPRPSIADSGEHSEAGITAFASNAPDRVFVPNDWAPLKAVLVGIPDNDVLPKWYPNKDNADGNELDYDVSRAGLTKREAAPKEFVACIEQLDAFCNLLESEGVTVYRPPLTDIAVAKDQPVGLTASWVRESFSIIGDCIIQNQCRAPHRNKERAALEPFFSKISRTMDRPIFRPPPCSGERQPDWENDPRVFIEGGDIFRTGKDVLVGMSYLATSPTGYRWLASLLEHLGVNVWPAYLTQDWLHMDYVLALVRPGLCVAYLKAFKDKLLPSPLTDWECVELTKDETNHKMCGNLLTIAPGKVLMPNASRRLLRLLERKNVDVLDVDMSAVAFFQGAADCATTELLRE